jgi:hypothetical protein
MLLMLCSLAYGNGAVAIEEGEKKEVEGPAVVLDELTYRNYVRDSRDLPACEEKLELAIDEGIAANERAIHARDVAKREFDADESLINTQVQTIATQGVRLDDLAAKNHRLKNQRNVAVGVATGFLAAATAAVVLSLD